MLERPRSFFFSSRRRHTRFDCDWSSDVCSSDLPGMRFLLVLGGRADSGTGTLHLGGELARLAHAQVTLLETGPGAAEKGERSEERRVGKECRSGLEPRH